MNLNPFSKNNVDSSIDKGTDAIAKVAENRSDGVAITAIFTLGLVIISTTFISVAGFVIVQSVSNFNQGTNSEIIQPEKNP